MTSFVILSSCSCSHVPTGPDVTVCVVDIKSSGYQCSGQAFHYFLRWDQGDHLHCATPMKGEAFLKACDEHNPIPFPDDDMREDNDFCVSDQDLTRIKQRCSIPRSLQ